MVICLQGPQHLQLSLGDAQLVGADDPFGVLRTPRHCHASLGKHITHCVKYLDNVMSHVIIVEV